MPGSSEVGDTSTLAPCAEEEKDSGRREGARRFKREGWCWEEYHCLFVPSLSPSVNLPAFFFAIIQIMRRDSEFGFGGRNAHPYDEG